MGIKTFLTARLWHAVVAQTHKLWVRVVIIGCSALVALGVARLSSVYLPTSWSLGIEIVAVDRLLNIISNSMLAVTTFSLTVMVTVYRSTASQWTPRIHRLIIEDRTTQNTLAAFIGAYVYALTGIILRETGLFDAKAVLPFFVLTVGVLVLIVVYMIRWVLHLQTFGSLMESTRQVEEKARSAIEDRVERNCLGGHPLRDDTDIPGENTAVTAPISGYVQFIYPERLQELAKRRGLRIYVLAEVGSFLFKGDVLARVVDHDAGESSKETDEDLSDAVSDAFIMGDVRTFDQDPRFGLMVMAEIGCKALSPGINDPGTAIDIIARQARLLMCFRAENDDPEYDRVWIKELKPQDLLRDAFGSIARDGAAAIEVQLRLQKALAGLARHADPAIARAAEETAANEYARAVQALTFGGDRAWLRSTVSPEIAKAAEATKGGA